MFGNDDDELRSILKYQGFSFLFSTLLESRNGAILLADEGSKSGLLHEIVISETLISRFIRLVFPDRREAEEVGVSELLSEDERNMLTSSTICHPDEEPCDWVLYETYKRKARTFNFDEGRKLETVKLFRMSHCRLSSRQDPGKEIPVDLRIYAILKRTDAISQGNRIYSPVVNIFAVIESERDSAAKEGLELIPINFPYIMIADGANEERNALQQFMLKIFRERFLDEINGASISEIRRERNNEFVGRIFKVYSLAVDSFGRFTPDPIFAYVRGMKHGNKHLLVVLYLLNLLFVDYDNFVTVDAEMYTPEFIENSFERLMRINETSTVTYAAPGCTVTVDDYGDVEVRDHIQSIWKNDDRAAFDYNRGGPRSEIVYHTLVLSTISSRNSILSYYERMITGSLSGADGKELEHVSRAGQIKAIVEKATGEFSLHTIGPFKSPSLEREYDELNRINSGNQMLESFQKNVDFYGRYAVEEQHHRLMVEQSERLSEERELLSELKNVLKNIDKSLKKTELLTALLIAISAVSVIIALLFSLKVI